MFVTEFVIQKFKQQKSQKNWGETRQKKSEKDEKSSRRRRTRILTILRSAIKKTCHPITTLSIKSGRLKDANFYLQCKTKYPSSCKFFVSLENFCTKIFLSKFVIPNLQKNFQVKENKIFKRENRLPSHEIFS